VSVEERLRQTLFNFLRRSQFAFREYFLAREQTNAYLKSKSVVSYFLAIGHWEVFLSYVYQAYELLARSDQEKKLTYSSQTTVRHSSECAFSTTGLST
jgi:hypothetical protein